MIFSQEKWNNAAQIREFVKVSNSLSWAVMRSPLTNAYERYLCTLLGDVLCERLIEVYNNSEPQALESRALRLCQRAVALLAFWESFDELNVRITDAGFQRQKSDNDTFQQAYKYQEDNLRWNFRNRGFNALDDVLEFFEKNIRDFPEFEKAPAYIKSRGCLIRNTEEVDNIYNIGRSRIIFLRMQQHIRFVQEMELPPIIGELLYKRLEEYLNGKERDIVLIENLRKATLGFAVTSAIYRLMAETGSLTDRGLYFESLTSKEGNMDAKPIPDSRLNLQLDRLKADKERYRARLTVFIKHNFPDLFGGDAKNIPDKDNDGHKIFFA